MYNNPVVPPGYQHSSKYVVPPGYNFDGRVVPNGYVHETGVGFPVTENDDQMPIGYDGERLKLPGLTPPRYNLPAQKNPGSYQASNPEGTAWGADIGSSSSETYANADFGYDSGLLSKMGELTSILGDENSWDSYYEKIKETTDGFPGGVYGMQAAMVLYMTLVKKIIDYLRAYRLKKFNDKLDSFLVTFSQISLDSATSTDRDAQIERLDDLRQQVDNYYPSENEKKEIKTNLLSLIVSMKTFLRSRDELVGGRRGTKRRRRRTGKRVRKTNKRRRQRKTYKRRKH